MNSLFYPIILITLILSYNYSVGQFNDNFSDNELLTNPEWTGDINKFNIIDGKLYSNSNVTYDEFYISTKSKKVLETEWKISLNCDFKTSSANYIDILLASDSINPSKANHAYFIRIGDTKDDVSMYRIFDGLTTQITNGSDNKTEKKKMDIQVTHQKNGKWTIEVDYNDGNPPLVEGVVDDVKITDSDFFSVRIKQSTSSFFKKHQLDDIEVGPITIDITPPRVDSLKVQGPKKIALFTNEPTLISDAVFKLNQNVGAPISYEVNNSKIQLYFKDSLKNNNYILSIEKLKDFHGNRIDTFLQFEVNLPKSPRIGDLIVNELFPDPSPKIGLPDAEYVELFNLKNYSLNLENCTLADENSVTTLPQIIIPENGYLILCNEADKELFHSIPNVYGVKSMPSLNNSSDVVIIKNRFGQLIDSINYTNLFYKNDIKKNGGYSLERIQPSSNCHDSLNWIGSNHPDGGTPGKVNSIDGLIYDTIPPYIISSNMINAKEIHLQLSEFPTNTEAFKLENYILVHSAIHPILVNIDELTTTISIHFEDPLPSNTIFTLNIGLLGDCMGNINQDIILKIIPIQKPKKDDIIINEILFNPNPDGVDFIELYNTSDYFFQLHDLTFKTSQSNPTSYSIQSNKNGIIHPHQFVALTIDTIQLKFDYPNSKELLQILKMPPMNNTSGDLSLYQSDVLLDSVLYHEDQHFELLSDYDGVSLERITFEGNGYDPNNWHSASSVEDYATPGYQNSQYTNTLKTMNQFELTSSIISPDGDGFEDFLILNYNMNNLGYVHNGYIYNLSGFQMLHPYNNIILGSKGSLKWDGLDSNGVKLPIGNYILLIEAFNDMGKIIHKKIAFGITGIF